MNPSTKPISQISENIIMNDYVGRLFLHQQTHILPRDFTCFDVDMSETVSATKTGPSKFKQSTGSRDRLAVYCI